MAQAQNQTQNSITGGPPQPEVVRRASAYFSIIGKKIDETVPYTTERWIVFTVLILMFITRILIVHAWYLVTYTMAIYLLNLFLAFLQPKFDPALKSDPSGLGNDARDEDESLSPLPTTTNGPLLDGEFRPFIRKLPEFKFWFHATQATIVALFCTLFEFTDIPVFWYYFQKLLTLLYRPILLVYFFILFGLTMRRQLKHMKKFKYVPFDIGKKTYSKK